MHNKTWNDLESMRKTRCLLTQMFEMDVCANGDNANVNVLSQVSDMVKDFAEAEEKAMKACYYKEVLDTMKKEREEEEDDDERAGYPRRGSTRMTRGMRRMGYAPMYDEHPYEDWNNGKMGYDHYRYSNGEFAPTGHGHYSGYTPTDGMGVSHVPPFMSNDMRYGTAYNEWKEAKKHYTANNSSNDKEEMDRKSLEHVANVMMSMRDIWKHADPDIRKKIKADLTSLVSEMA